MKLTVFVLPLLLASALAHANTDHSGHQVNCEITSDYNLSTYRQAFVYSQEDGKPAQIAIGGGRLFVDGQEAALSEQDHGRVSQLEGELRLLMPQVQQIALEGIDIAFTALTEVARGLSDNPQKTVDALNGARQRLTLEVASKPLILFNEHAIGANTLDGVIEPIVTEFVPEVIGGALSMAFKSVFASEKERNAMTARMQRMKQDIDSKIEPRANALEPLVEAMCQRLQRMDAIDNSLSYRQPNGKALDLLRVDAKGDHTP